MVRNAAISVRTDDEFKAELEKQASAEGRTLASYVERVLRLHHQMPVWKLSECQPLNRKKYGPHVVIPIAEGWPSAGLPAAKAEALGERLIEAAKLARKMAPSD